MTPSVHLEMISKCNLFELVPILRYLGIKRIADTRIELELEPAGPAWRPPERKVETEEEFLVKQEEEVAKAPVLQDDGLTEETQMDLYGFVTRPAPKREK